MHAKVGWEKKKTLKAKKKKKGLSHEPTRIIMWTHFSHITLSAMPNFCLLFSCQEKIKKLAGKQAPLKISVSAFHIAHLKKQKQNKTKTAFLAKAHETNLFFFLPMGGIGLQRWLSLVLLYYIQKKILWFPVLFLIMNLHSPYVQWHSQGLPGWASRPPGRPKWGEKMKEIWGKMREPTGKWGKIEEMFLSCPPRSERLATGLLMCSLSNVWNKNIPPIFQIFGC